MLISNQATFQLFISDQKSSLSRMQSSMAKISSGERFIAPGEAPADLGISESFRSQIKKSAAAGQNIQNAINLFQTADSFMGSVHDMLGRLAELAVSAADSSKNQADRVNLDLEFQQLKTEISRVSEAGKYNSLQINGKTAVGVWDAIDKQIVFTQADGSDQRDLGIVMRSGNTATNGIHYAFESSAQGSVGDFLFSDDGRYLIYISQQTIASEGLTAQRTIMKLDLQSNTIATVDLSAAASSNAATSAPRLSMDDTGRIWVSSPNAAASGYSVALLQVDNMELDYGTPVLSTSVWAGGVTLASSNSQFSVNGNYMYFFQSGANGQIDYVRRNLFDQLDTEILQADVSGLFGMNPGENYVISDDGLYFAFKDTNNSDGQVHLTVVNSFTGKSGDLITGDRSNSIVALDFDGNNNLYWTDTGTVDDKNVIKRVSIRFGDTPILFDEKIIVNENDGHLGAFDSAQAALGFGMSVGGGSPASRYLFQVGPDDGMNVDFISADARLVKLGISKTQVKDIKDALEAIPLLNTAVDRLANQRAIIGSQVSRLGFIFSSNDAYKNNISQAESRLRDVDFAEESAELARSQVMAQAATQILRTSNQNVQLPLSLLS